jgi:hypothetical protein
MNVPGDDFGKKQCKTFEKLSSYRIIERMLLKKKEKKIRATHIIQNFLKMF